MKKIKMIVSFALFAAVFVCLAEERSVAVSPLVQTADVFSFTATVSGGEASESNSVVMAWGATDAGDSFGDWPNFKVVSEIGQGETSLGAPQPAGWGDSVKAVRFFIVKGLYRPYAREVEYLKSNGSSSFDNLGYCLTSNSKVVMKFQYAKQSGGIFLGVGGGVDPSGHYWRFFAIPTALILDINNESDGRLWMGAISSDRVYHLEVGNHYVYDWDAGAYLGQGTTMSMTTLSTPMTLMTTGDNGDYGTIYFINIRENDTDGATADFIPVVDWNGHAAMYDKVSGNVYSCLIDDSHDDFEKGPTVATMANESFDAQPSIVFSEPEHANPIVSAISGTGVVRTPGVLSDLYRFTDVNAPSSISFSRDGYVEVLAIGGGGGGGGTIGAGGGGCGFVHKERLFVKAGTYSITVGAGGAYGNQGYNGSNGGDTTFGASLVAYGGGGGGSYSVCRGNDGASGGGSCCAASGYASGIDGQGHRGGTAYYDIAGGGGGAGEAGGDAPVASGTGNACGKGGDGLPCDITGERVWYAGGGGGGAGGGAYNDHSSTYGGAGGKGGGGAGHNRDARVPGDDGVDGLGGGGGGGCHAANENGGRGGNGVLIIKVLTADTGDGVADIEAKPMTDIHSFDATVNWNLLDFGAGSESAAVTIEYGTASGSYLNARTLSSAASLGAGSALLDALSEGTTYYARLKVLGDGEDNTVGTTAEFSFTTPVATVASVLPESIGLWEAHILGNGVDFSTDILSFEEGTAETARHRALLPGMMYTSTSYENTLAGATYSWCNNSTWCYRGYMYFGTAGVWNFITAQDDTALIRIDGTDVLNVQTYSNGATATWTCPAAGWYAVDFRSGDFWGSSGMISEGICFHWSTDNGSTWNRFSDPGDGSVFRTSIDRPVTLKSATQTDGTVRADLDFGAAFVGCALYVRSGDNPTNLTDWTSSALGSPTSASSVEEFAVGAGASYFQFYFTVDGTDYAGPVLSLGDVRTVAASDPDAEFVTTGAVDCCAAELSVNVVTTGGGCETCSIVVEYGTSSDLLDHLATFDDLAVGLRTVRLTGLAPETTYFFSLHPVNASAHTGAATAVASLTTIPLAKEWDWYERNSQPGLIQALRTGVNDVDMTSAFATGTSEFHRELGAVASFVRTWEKYNASSYTSSLDGGSYVTSWRDHIEYDSLGYMWFESGVKYVFAICFDDAAWIRTDDDTPAKGGIEFMSYEKTFETSGWHPIEVRLMNHSGGAGGQVDTAFGDIAVAWTTNADAIAAINGPSTPTNGWYRFMDSGDGSLLRTAKPVRSVSVASTSVGAEGFTATLAIGAATGSSTVALKAAWGYANGGNDPANWEHVVTLTDALPSETDAWTAVLNVSSAVVRFFTESADGSVEWSETVYAADATVPSIGSDFTLNGEAGDTLVVTGRLDYAGGATAAVTVEVSEKSDMTGSYVRALGDFASGDEIACTIHSDNQLDDDYIRPGATYYVRLVARTSGGISSSPIRSVTTPAGGSVSNLSFAQNGLVLTVSANVDEVGIPNGAELVLLVGTSADALAEVATNVVTGTGSASFIYEPGTMNARYYQVKIRNFCSTAAFASGTAVTTASLTDSSVWYWVGPENGAWSTTANWENSWGDVKDVLGDFPNSYSAVVDFSRAAAPVKVAVDGFYAISRVSPGVPNLTVEFVGTGVDASRLYMKTLNPDTEANLADGSSIVLRDCMWYQDAGEIVPLPNGAIRLYRSTLQANCAITLRKDHSRLELHDGSLLTFQSGAIQVHGVGTRIVLDDSVCQFTSIWDGTFRFGIFTGDADNVFEFFGKNPQLNVRCAMQFGDQGSLGDNHPTFLFHVPKGGYDNPPVNLADVGNRGNAFNPNGNTVVDLEVASDSPALAVAKKLTTRLVDFRKGSVNSAWVNFVTHSSSQSMAFGYGDADATEPSEEAPNAESVFYTYEGRGLSVILR